MESTRVRMRRLWGDDGNWGVGDDEIGVGKGKEATSRSARRLTRFISERQVLRYIRLGDRRPIDLYTPFEILFRQERFEQLFRIDVGPYFFNGTGCAG